MLFCIYPKWISLVSHIVCSIYRSREKEDLLQLNRIVGERNVVFISISKHHHPIGNYAHVCFGVLVHSLYILAYVLSIILLILPVP